MLITNIEELENEKKVKTYSCGSQRQSHEIRTRLGMVPIKVYKHEKTGRIINVSSVVGVAGNAGQTNYSASKAGIIGFTKSLAKEVASRNILVNAVAPGFIATDMTSVLSDSVQENINNQIPLRKMGTAEDVAKVVKFLASEDSSYVTGQVINVDGGMVM